MSLNYGLTEDFTLIQIDSSNFRKRNIDNTDSFYSHPSKYETRPIGLNFGDWEYEKINSAFRLG